jgi:hypothetical protein
LQSTHPCAAELLPRRRAARLRLQPNRRGLLRGKLRLPRRQRQVRRRACSRCSGRGPRGRRACRMEGRAGRRARRCLPKRVVGMPHHRDDDRRRLWHPGRGRVWPWPSCSWRRGRHKLGRLFLRERLLREGLNCRPKAPPPCCPRLQSLPCPARHRDTAWSSCHASSLLQCVLVRLDGRLSQSATCRRPGP